MTAVPPPSESSRLRASDEDRDRTPDVLRAAASTSASIRMANAATR